MYFRKNYDFSPDKEDFQIGEIDLSIKIKDTLYGGAGRFGDSFNQLHLEFENEEEIDEFIDFLKIFKSSAYLTRVGYYKKPLLKNTYQYLERYKIN